MNQGLEVLALTKSKLRKSLDENQFWQANEQSATSKNKAQWILNSPRLKDEDYCLVLGLNNDKIVAFIFLLPDYLNNPEADEKAVYWMIEWWVATEFGDTILGTYVFNEALKLTDKRILIKSYAEKVSSFYAKQAFKPILTRQRHTIFFGLNPDVIIGKFSFTKPFKFLIKLLNYAVFGMVNSINKRRTNKSTADLKYEYINILDDECWSFVAPLCKSDLILKTQDYLNWQLDPRQYLITPVVNKFSSLAQVRGYSYNINVFNIIVNSNNKKIGFISMLLFNDEIYLKYFLCEEENLNTMVNALMEHMITLKASHIFTDNEKVAKQITSRYIKTISYSTAKTALAHETIHSEVGSLKINDQDGHFL